MIVILTSIVACFNLILNFSYFINHIFMSLIYFLYSLFSFVGATLNSLWLTVPHVK